MWLHMKGHMLGMAGLAGPGPGSGRFIPPPLAWGRTGRPRGKPGRRPGNGWPGSRRPGLRPSMLPSSFISVSLWCHWSKSKVQIASVIEGRCLPPGPWGRALTPDLACKLRKLARQPEPGGAGQTGPDCGPDLQTAADSRHSEASVYSDHKYCDVETESVFRFLLFSFGNLSLYFAQVTGAWSRVAWGIWLALGRCQENILRFGKLQSCNSATSDVLLPEKLHWRWFCLAVRAGSN